MGFGEVGLWFPMREAPARGPKKPELRNCELPPKSAISAEKTLKTKRNAQLREQAGFNSEPKLLNRNPSPELRLLNS